jgi:hypothetical protein
LLPKILADLKLYRKQAKKDMGKVGKNDPLYNIYNSKQLAYKISMNSVYGFTGALKGMLSCLPIASTVTRQGRDMIKASKDYVEEHFPGAKVRYGDSVMPGTPVLTKNGPRTIECLGTNWIEYPGFKPDEELEGKEQSDWSGEVWTSSGWARVHRVIRHRCKKKIYRILTYTGCVDVTEDHSLLDPALHQVKPSQVTIGTQLYHSFPENFMMGSEISQELAYIYGVFVGDGSCGAYDGKYSWAINNKDLDLLDKCKAILENIYKEPFKILDTIDSSGVYKLVPCHRDLKSYTQHFRTECYDGQAKKIPSSVFGSRDNMQAFLDGLFDTDGCRRDLEVIGCRRIDTKHHITAQWYYLLLRSLGHQVSLNTRKDKPHVFRLTWSDPMRKDPTAIKKIDVLHEAWDGYVYDLETDAGTFQAGVGQMIVKNTDSIMVEFGPDDLEECWKLGERASKEVTAIFKRPNDLELEKIYWPYVLYSKKRYAAKMWVHDGSKVVFDHVDVKGLQVVRRDNCEYVRTTCQKVIEMLLDSQWIDLPKYIDQQRDDLVNGRVPMERLIMSKRLGSEYKNNNLAHVVVRDKIKERRPGSEPMSGDRVQFVITLGTGPNGKPAKEMYKKAEDPEWVREHGIALDYQYYLKHQFESPIEDLMEPIK